MCRYLDITPPRWVEEQYRICADVSEGWGEDGVGGGLHVFYLEQTLILSPPPHLNLNPDANPNPDASPGVGGGWNVFYLKGRWYRQHYVNIHPPGLLEGAFFHFQARYLVITPPSRALTPRGVEINVRAAAQH